MRIFKHPIKKLTLLTAFGGGYVLGARAGRDRYEQIKQTANQVKDDPRVQDAASRAEDLVRDTATKVTDDPRVKDVVSRAEDILRDAGLHTGEDGKHAEASTGDASPAETSAADTSAADDDAAEKLRDIAKASGIADSADTSTADTASKNTTSTPAGTDDDVNPLLADEHIGLEEEIVYTSGPDIEESIDQLADLDRVEQDITDDKRDNA